MVVEGTGPAWGTGEAPDIAASDRARRAWVYMIHFFFWSFQAFWGV